MPYTVWFDGLRIGETAFEMRHGARRRAGIFQPTEIGMSVLPGITAMAPALLDTGRECQARRLHLEDADPDPEVMESVLETLPGRRMMEAAKHIARLELRDPSGDPVEWESILISDLLELRTLAGASSEPHPDTQPEEPELAELPKLLNGDPIRYLISATFLDRRRVPPRRRPMM